MARSQGFFTVVNSLANRWMRGQMLGPGYLDGNLPPPDKAYEAQLALPTAGGLWICVPKDIGWTWRQLTGIEDWGEFLISRVDQWPNIIIQNFSDLDPWQGPYLLFRRSRGGSETDFTVVANGDELGGVEFWGADGTNWAPGAAIYALVDGTPGNNDMPTALAFWTSPDGSQTMVERVRIKPDGTTWFFKDINIDAATGWAPLGLDGATQGGTLDFYKNGNYQGSFYSESGNSLRIYDNAYGGDSLISSNGDITLPKYAGSGARGISVDSNGKLVAATTPVLVASASGSAVSSIALNNCFSANYENYEILIRFTTSAATPPVFKLRAGGSVTTASLWDYWQVRGTSGTTTVGSGTNATVTFYALHGSPAASFESGVCRMIVGSPFAARRTEVLHQSNAHTTEAALVSHYSGGGGVYDNTTSYDGFQIEVSSGTLTGQIWVYGLPGNS